MNVSRDIGLHTGFAERLTKPLYTLATSVIQLSEFNEGCGADTADLAWCRHPTKCSAEAAKHVSCLVVRYFSENSRIFDKWVFCSRAKMASKLRACEIHTGSLVRAVSGEFGEGRSPAKNRAVSSGVAEDVNLWLETKAREKPSQVTELPVWANFTTGHLWNSARLRLSYCSACFVFLARR